jgi:hypothetical protein
MTNRRPDPAASPGGAEVPAGHGPAAGEQDADVEARIGLRRAHQAVIDAEMRISRRAVLAAFRHRLRTDPGTLIDEEFLDLADRAAVRTAIIVAAGGVADACALQIRDPYTGVLRVARHRGLRPALVKHLAATPARFDDPAVRPVSTGPAASGASPAAGFRSMHCHPLHDRHGHLLGLLFLQYRTADPDPEPDRLVRAAAHALAHVQARAAPPAHRAARRGHRGGLARTVTDRLAPRPPLCIADDVVRDQVR